jgi:hypothetical protein
MLTFSLNSKQKVFSFTKPHSDVGRAWLGEAFVRHVTDGGKNKIVSDAWGRTCQKNDDLVRGTREVSALTQEDFEIGHTKGVSDVVFAKQCESLEDLFKTEEMKSIIEDFIILQNDILIERGISLFSLLSSAKESMSSKNGDKDTITLLQKIIKSENCAEIVTEVLRNKELYTYLSNKIGA